MSHTSLYPFSCDKGVFEGCISQTSVEISASVNYIRPIAFKNNLLNNLTFEEVSQLTYIGDGAFDISSNCVKLDL
ncbi:leucine-rich repeat protein [uncultured Alistipes sp.]|uniref:leucine-rich repeat protein n=1 Tax=uncultured Alistipes sp. TaxID=538949 RepID=UPI00351A419B